jgi:hypothetical protein
MRGSVTDDAQGFATMYPSQFPDLLDISSTPNRLLQSNLTDQVRVWPCTVLHVRLAKQHINYGNILLRWHSIAVTAL